MNTQSSTRLRRTALFEWHCAAGARLLPASGWEMPFLYENVNDEVRAVRQNCGVFDLSHQAQMRFEGEGVTQWLNEIVSTDWESVAPGRAAYALLLNERGGVIDDVMGYRLSADAWLLIANDSRAQVNEAHFRAHLPDGIEMNVGGEDSALIALQGPKSQEILQKLIGESLAEVAWRDVILMGGTEAVLARSGDCGGDGFEIVLNADDAPALWKALLRCGAVPCGLGAREVLRIEAALPLFGRELREDWTPAESGVAFAAQTAKPRFIGRAALLEKLEISHTIQALRMNDEAVARDADRVLDANGQTIGEITSGAFSPTLGCGIALAHLPRNSEIGDEVSVEVDGVFHGAQVVTAFIPTERK